MVLFLRLHLYAYRLCLVRTTFRLNLTVLQAFTVLRCCWFVLLLLAVVQSASWRLQAQTIAPKYSNEFLKIGVGARAFALGGAVTAIAEDATAAYWNPAGLMHLPRNYEVGLMRSEYFSGIAKYDYGGFVAKVDSQSRIGFTFIRLGVDDIANTTNFRDGNTFNYSAITAFSIADMALIISYARQVMQVQGLSFGTNLKIINRGVGQFGQAWGFGMDAGLQYRRKALLLGLMAADITSTFNAWSFNTETFSQAFIATGNTVPQNSVELTLPSARLGAAYQFLQGKPVTVLASAELAANFDGPRNVLWNAGRISFDPRLGLEVGYKKWVYLRAGVMNIQRITNPDNTRSLTAYPTAGLGINIPIPNYILQLDYALSNFVGIGQQGLYSHTISLRFAFDKLVVKK